MKRRPFVVVASLVWGAGASAFAQPAPAPAGTGTMQVATVQSGALPETQPTGQPGAQGTPPVVAPPAAPDPGAAPPAAPAKPWYETLDYDAFVDAYVGINYNFPAPGAPTPLGGGNQYRVYDLANGGNLSWAGLNLSYAPDPIGGTISLRFGPTAKTHALADAAVGLENVKQAYVSLKPGGADGKITIDFGKYDQPFGSEYADSQPNINYTRAPIYGLAQPFFFTGFRLDYAISSVIDVKLFLINGWNTTVDNNVGKTGGIQLTIKPNDAFAAYLGYVVGPEQADTRTVTCPAENALAVVPDACKDAAPGADVIESDPKANERFRHLGDLVLDLTPTRSFRALLNADVFAEQVADGDRTRFVLAYGGNLAMRVAFNDVVSLGGRGGVYFDRDGFTMATGVPTMLYDGTVTVGVDPTPNFQFKLDLRVDASDQSVFQRGTNDHVTTQWTSTLGMVAKTR